jgi:hypothetical protein
MNIILCCRVTFILIIWRFKLSKRFLQIKQIKFILNICLVECALFSYWSYDDLIQDCTVSSKKLMEEQISAVRGVDGRELWHVRKKRVQMRIDLQGRKCVFFVCAFEYDNDQKFSLWVYDFVSSRSEVCFVRIKPFIKNTVTRIIS